MFFLQLLLQGNGNLVFLISFFCYNYDFFYAVWEGTATYFSSVILILFVVGYCASHESVYKNEIQDASWHLHLMFLGKSIALWVINNIMRHALFSGLFRFIRTLMRNDRVVLHKWNTSWIHFLKLKCKNTCHCYTNYLVGCKWQSDKGVFTKN